MRVRGGDCPPPPEGASNPQPVLWIMPAIELEPLWFTALLLRVQEVFGCYISLHSARSACRLTALGRTNLRCQGQSSG